MPRRIGTSHLAGIALKAWSGLRSEDPLHTRRLRKSRCTRNPSGREWPRQFTIAPGKRGYRKGVRHPLLATSVGLRHSDRAIGAFSALREQYGAYLRIEIDNPIVHPAMQRIPAIGKLLDIFEIGPAPMSGSATTVKQTTRTLAPSMRMNADLGDWDASLLNVQIGQSGQPLSGHYKDEWNDYYNGRSYPMQFQKVQAKSTLELRPGR